MSRRRWIDLGKYLLAVVLLGWVVQANWAPKPTRAIATLAVSTLGLVQGPAGPLLAASSMVPGQIEPRGLGYVWNRHVLQQEPIHLGFLLLGFVGFSMAVMLTFFRWYVLVRALDLELKLQDAIRFGFIGVFFNTFLPGAIGGDIIKAAALARTQSRRTAAVATVIMDRLLALWALVWFVAILGSVFWALGWLTGPAGPTAVAIVRTALSVVAISALVWVVVGFLPDEWSARFSAYLERIPGVGPSLGEMWSSVWMYRRRQGSVALVLILTWIGQVGFVFAFWCAAQVLWSPELGPVPSLLEHFLLVPIGVVMQALVPTPGGAGGGEWGFAALYLLFRAAEANGVMASLVQRMYSWVLGLVGYTIYLYLKPGSVQSEKPNPVRKDDSLPDRSVV